MIIDMNYTIRKIKETEYPLLKDFLYEAIFLPDGVWSGSIFVESENSPKRWSDKERGR